MHTIQSLVGVDEVPFRMIASTDVHVVKLCSRLRTDNGLIAIAIVLMCSRLGCFCAFKKDDALLRVHVGELAVGRYSIVLSEQ